MSQSAEERRERRKAYYEQDFDPGYTASGVPNPELRKANALEYAAYQLGQINRKLDKLIAAVELAATKM